MTPKQRAKAGKTENGSPDPSFPVVGIGASAGGLEAITELFQHLPKSGMAYVVIQHLDPSRESLLPEILAQRTGMKVREARHGDVLEADHVYVIPPNHFLTLAEGNLQLSARDRGLSPFLPIDRFFHSLAGNYGPRAIGVILSGGGSDGALGLQEIRENGGITFAQSELTSQFSSMPKSAVSRGGVDFVLSPKEIGEQISHLGSQKHWTRPLAGEVPKAPAQENEELRNLLTLVHKLSGIDFSNYKPPTILRRITRRMAIRRVSSLADYHRLLAENPDEVKAFCQDVLIQVTSFFRDEEVFRSLPEQVFPTLFVGRGPKDPVRIWIPGCSTGEEAYSVLICLTEFMLGAGLRNPVQLFGTDVSEKAISWARAGTYLENAVAGLSPERLGRFFTKNGHEYTIDKALRDSCIFAKHNVLTDPPFARMDLISCQNVLIYFDKSLQRRVLAIFHYALKPAGILLLGRAESTGARPELFKPLEATGRVFQKGPTSNRLYYDFVGVQTAAERVMPGVPVIGGDEVSRGLQVQRETDRLMLAEFAPPAVVLTDNLEVFQFKGHTGPYFEHSPGTASLDLLKMLKGSLIADVREALDAIRKKEERVRREGILVRVNGHTVRVAIELFPVRLPASEERYYLLTFEDMDNPALAYARQQREWKKAVEAAIPQNEEIASLRAELAATKEYLQSVNEDKETANEELKAANEEIMSSNEELQSTNEELHTAKEELQSANEELLTVNNELQHRNQELTLANNDLHNLFESLNVGIVMLNRELRVRRFTSLAATLFSLSPADLDRPLIDLRPRLEIDDLEKILRRALDSMIPVEMKAKGPEGKLYTIEVRPYRTSDHRIDGLVVIVMEA